MMRGLCLTLALGMAVAGCSNSNTTSTSTTPSSVGEAPMAPVEPAPPPPAPEPPPPPASPPAPQTARYEVTFESTWRAETHPTDFPSDAHYSGLVGGTHTPAVSFWRVGGPASEGIRLMAERGRKSPLTDEVQAAINGGTAEFILSGDALSTSPGTVRMEFEISQSFPLVTLVTMVAPSPDWFVGVSGLTLFENGAWVSERTVPLLPYDAGTDSGLTYRSPDEETSPRQPVSLLAGDPAIYNGTVAPFGTFRFRQLP